MGRRRVNSPSQTPVGYHTQATHFGCLFAWSNSGFSRPLPCCGRWMSSPVHRAPAGRERLLSTRGSPVGSRAPRGEDTSEPVPRPGLCFSFFRNKSRIAFFQQRASINYVRKVDVISAT